MAVSHALSAAANRSRAGMAQLRSAFRSVRGPISKKWPGKNADPRRPASSSPAHARARDNEPDMELAATSALGRSGRSESAATAAALARPRDSTRSSLGLRNRAVSGDNSNAEKKPPKEGAMPSQRFESSLGSRMVLPPEHRLVQRWDLLVAGVLAVQAFTLPLQQAFLPEGKLEMWPWCMWMDSWFDLVFWLDMCLRFFLQVEALDKSHFISDKYVIAERYFKGMFLIDFLAVFPLGRLILELSGGPSTGEDAWEQVSFDTPDLSWQMFCTICRFHKLLRFWRIRRVWGSLQSHTSVVGMVLKLTYVNNAVYSTFAVVIFTIHVMACIWSSLAVESKKAQDDSIASWYEFYVVGKHYHKDDFIGESLGLIYLSSIYWAVFTVTGIGYGDITPATPLEYSVSIICMLVGAITWAWVVASVVAIMATVNSSQNDHLMTLDCITELLQENSVKGTLGRKLREYFTKLKDVRDFEYVDKVIETLSPELKIEVCYCVHKDFIKSVWWLDKLPVRSEFIVDIAHSMKSVLHTPSEFVPNKCELSIIRKGLCIHGGMLLAKGQVYGQDMILDNEVLRKPFATLALAYLHLSVLTKPSFNAALDRHPDVQPHIRKCYVKFVVMRGLLYRAEVTRAAIRRSIRSNEKAAEGGRMWKRRLSVRDRSLTAKPTGDLDDLFVNGQGRPGKRGECFDDCEFDPNNPGEVQQSGFNNRLRRSRERASPTDVQLVPGGSGGCPAPNGVSSGVSLTEVSTLLDRVLDAETKLRSRMTSVEAVAAQLAQQVELLRTL
eukprot:TRINITY_DN24921_c0_g1_i1.p1 TRINITY_DN24921_c0_g1~~TRINITY_DN24921_c0_g1_i1.p1  ORF type:complete len:781 (+),score=99.89 TRINITY_DN24921_c0_g1_i1:206-2548(+)